jgi:hypothetical protein
LHESGVLSTGGNIPFSDKEQKMSDLHVNGPVIVTDPQVSESTADSAPGTIFPKISRAAAVYTSGAFFNPNAKGVRIWIFGDGNGGNTSACKLQQFDPASGNWTDITNANAAGVGAGGGAFVVYPGITGIADVAGSMINNHLGYIWRAILTVSTGPQTVSIGAQYLL